MAHHGTSWDGWRRWRARRLRMVRLWMLRLLRMQHELLILALCLVCGAVAPLAVSSSEIHGMELVAGCTAIAGEMCHARMLSPVPDGLIVRGFDRPEWQWSPGHRGVDISLNGMHELLAPSDGAISFSGMVAGKSVVSIDTGPYTLTFEPAHTQLAVGDKVHRGKRFASVGGQSDARGAGTISIRRHSCVQCRFGWFPIPNSVPPAHHITCRRRPMRCIPDRSMRPSDLRHSRPAGSYAVWGSPNRSRRWF